MSRSFTSPGDRMNRLWWPQRKVIESGAERITGDENDSDRVAGVFDAWRQFRSDAGGRRGWVEFNQGDGGWFSQQRRRGRLRAVWFSAGVSERFQNRDEKDQEQNRKQAGGLHIRRRQSRRLRGVGVPRRKCERSTRSQSHWNAEGRSWRVERCGGKDGTAEIRRRAVQLQGRAADADDTHYIFGGAALRSRPLDAFFQYLLDSLRCCLDTVHPEYEPWRVGVGDAFATNFFGEAGHALERNRQWLRA